MADTENLSLAYEAERTEPNDPVAQAKKEYEQFKASKLAQAQEQQDIKDTVNPPKPEKADGEGRSFIEDVGTGLVEGVPQIAGGFLDAIQEASIALESVIPLGTIGGDDEFTREKNPLKVGEADSVTGGLIRGVSQFVTGFIPAVKALKAVGVTGAVTSAMGGGAIADALVFDPHEERLSDLVESNPDLSNPITEYLSANPEDSDAEGRFKNAIEGLALGGLADGLVKTVKLMKRQRESNTEKLATKREDIQLNKQAESEVSDELAGDLPTDLPSDAIAETLGTGAQLSRVKEGQVESIIRDTHGDSDQAFNINLNKIDSEDDVKNILRNVANKFTPELNDAARGVQSHEETAKLADALGMTPQDLINRNKGEAFNAEQSVAARKLMVANADVLVKLGKQAAKTGSRNDKLAVIKASIVQRAIQEQITGVTAEAGRALNAFKITAKSEKAQIDQINALLNGSGNVDELIESIANADNVTAVNNIIKNAQKATFKDVAIESWYNGILSSPATHVVNILGNSLNVFWNAGTRVVTPVIGKVLGDQETSFAEAGQAFYGMIEGAKDGFVMAGKALKSSDFELEGFGTIERTSSRNKRAISAETFNATGVVGQGIDYLGSVIRTPGRSLLAGDAFFRSINQRMELRALSYRQATDEGLTGQAAATRMQQIMNDPPEEILNASTGFSRVQTFTNELGTAGQGLQQLANNFAPAKLLMPFIRTPINIIKTVGVNSPLAPFAGSVRADIMAGGARRDKALAQMGMGSSVMAVTASLQAEGILSGGGPADPNLKRTMELSGWKPYSILVGDTYYSYSRLDPIGATIGIAADIAEISGNASEADILDITGTAVLATAKNLASKTYLSGVTQFFSALQQAKDDPNKENRAITRYFENLVSSFVPLSALGAAFERQVDPTTRATEGVLERIRSRTAGFSEDLPPILNVFGEVVMNGGGVGPDIMSPVYTSVKKEDPVVDELVRIEMPMSMPPKSIQGIRLTTQEYHDYVLLAAKGVVSNNRNHKQAIEKEMKKASYKRLTKAAKRLTVERITAGYRQGATKLFIKNNTEFGLKIKEAQAQKTLDLTGRG